MKRTVKPFRLDQSLIDALEVMAKKHNRNLNNLVETILLREVNIDPKEKRFTLEELRKAYSTFRYRPFPHNDPEFEQWLEDFMLHRGVQPGTKMEIKLNP